MILKIIELKKGVKFKINGKDITVAELINKQIPATRGVMKTLYSLSSGKDFMFDDKIKYLHACIDDAEKINAPETEL